MFSWSLYSSEYDEALKRIQITEQAKQSLKSIPGVGEVGIINPLPLSGSDTFSSYYVEGTPMPETGEVVTVSRFWANHDFATAVGLKLRAGRFFTEFDTPEGQPVAVIDSKFARQIFPDTDPIGRRINIDGGPPSDPNDWKTIIGVVEHVSQYGLTREAHKQIYVPITQEPPRFVSFIIETNAEPMTLSKAIRKTMSNIDPNLPIQRLQPYDALFERTISNERLLMQLLAILSALALVLATVGLYGVLSYTVRQRTQEIGIRMAIGALPQTVRNLILSSGLRLASIAGPVAIPQQYALRRIGVRCRLICNGRARIGNGRTFRMLGSRLSSDPYCSITRSAWRVGLIRKENLSEKSPRSKKSLPVAFRQSSGSKTRPKGTLRTLSSYPLGGG